MSETPRTDVVQEKITKMHMDKGTFPSEGFTELTLHARQLERELEEANKRADHHRSARVFADSLAETYCKEAEALRERLRILSSTRN